jgi:hypothetical protein
MLQRVKRTSKTQVQSTPYYIRGKVANSKIAAPSSMSASADLHLQLTSTCADTGDSLVNLHQLNKTLSSIARLNHCVSCPLVRIRDSNGRRPKLVGRIPTLTPFGSFDFCIASSHTDIALRHQVSDSTACRRWLSGSRWPRSFCH